MEKIDLFYLGMALPVGHWTCVLQAVEPHIPEQAHRNMLEQLVALLSKHYSPESTEVMWHFHFNSRLRKVSESVAVYVVELCRLAEYCNYEDHWKI